MKIIIKVVRKNPLFFAFLFPAVSDGFLTLYGQDISYWTSRSVNEASPAYYFLSASPWLFVLGCLIWFLFWYWAVKRLKEPFNLFLIFLFIAGHSWGSGAWIWKLMKSNNVYSPNDQVSIIFAWFLVVVYFVLIAFSAATCLNIYLPKEKIITRRA